MVGLQFMVWQMSDIMMNYMPENICIPETVFLIAIYKDIFVALCTSYSLKSNNEKTNPVQFVFECATKIEVIQTHSGAHPMKHRLTLLKHKTKLRLCGVE